MTCSTSSPGKGFCTYCRQVKAEAEFVEITLTNGRTRCICTTCLARRRSSNPLKRLRQAHHVPKDKT